MADRPASVTAAGVAAAGVAAAGRTAGRWWLRFAAGPLVARLVARWWWRRGLRARVTLIGAAGLLVAFAAADLLLFNALRASLIRSVDDSARTGASQVAALIDANRLPDPVPVAAGTITIQVLDAAGRITDVSPGADRLVPLVPPAQAAALADSSSAVLVQGAPFDMPSLLRVAVVPASGGSLVIAAVPYSAASGSLSVVEKALVFGTPVLFIAFTGAIWLVVGSALRPIDLLRRGAARVTSTSLPEPLPVPEARDEVRSLALTLNDMLSRLASAQQRQRALVSDTAHELRSPIASIRTQLEVALDHPQSQSWEETARDVLADTLRLSRLTEDLLLLARLDEQAGTAATGAARPGLPVDLAELAGSVVGRYCDARVPVTIGPAEPQRTGAVVLGDRERLDRLLVNLIDNAVRYAKSSVTVTVTVSGAGSAAAGGGPGRVEIAVGDDGPGIAAADRERAFDRFARLDDARARDDDGAGAGLGLAIVRATAQAYGGTADLRDNPDGEPGLRAVIRFPASPANAGLP